MKRSYHKLPAISARQAVQQLIADAGRCDGVYIVSDLGGLLRLLLKLSDAGYGGHLSYWPITDKQPSICAFMVYSPSMRGRWKITAGSLPAERQRRGGRRRR